VSDALLAELERKAGELEADLRQMRHELARMDAIEEDVEDLFGELDERAAPDVPMHVKLRGAEGYPFGVEYPFGISISGAAVTVYEQVVYRGGVPLTLATDTVTIETDGDWVALQIAPSSEAGSDTLALVRWPAADGVPADKDGFIYRGLHKFNFADDVATWAKAGWVGGDLSMMGY